MKCFIVETKTNLTLNDNLLETNVKTRYCNTIEESMEIFEFEQRSSEISSCLFKKGEDYHIAIWLKVMEGDTVVTLKHCFIHNGEVL